MTNDTTLDAAALNGHARVPTDLTDRDQWVFWKWEQRGDKRTKVLHDPHTGHKADATDPGTWGTYQEAVNACQRHHAAGVGIVFSEDDTLAGVDLDDCCDPDTGITYPEAQKIIDGLDSYTEVSPSGTGVKVFLHGTKPGDRCRTKGPWGGDIEIYDSGRFFTVTGNHLPGTPDAIRNRDQVFNWLYKDTFGATIDQHAADISQAPMPPEGTTVSDVIKTLEGFKNADEFRRLFHDDPDPDQLSEDDFALVNRVVFVTGGDVDLAERVLRRSARVRGRWDELRKGTPKIRWEIEKATIRRDPEDFYMWGRNVSGQYSTPHDLEAAPVGR